LLDAYREHFCDGDKLREELLWFFRGYSSEPLIHCRKERLADHECCIVSVGYRLLRGGQCSLDQGLDLLAEVVVKRPAA